MRLAWVILALAAASAVILATSTESQTRNADGGHVVYATFYPYHEFVAGIAGNAARTAQLAPDGARMHEWEPGAGDIQRLHGAYAIVFGSEAAEPYAGRLAELEGLEGVAFIPASPHSGGGEASHTWLDPIDVIAQVDTIRDGLAEVDPDNAEAYERNAAGYIKVLEDLDAKYSAGLADCEHGTIISFHNAYGHLAERYGLEVFGIASGHHAESSAGEIASMIEFARGSGASVIFADDFADPRREQAVADELGIDVSYLDTLESRGTHGDESYFERMSENLGTLREGLGCK